MRYRTSIQTLKENFTSIISGKNTTNIIPSIFSMRKIPKVVKAYMP